MNKKEIKKIDGQIEVYQTKRFFILFVVLVVFGLLTFLTISNSNNAGLIGVAFFAPLMALLFFLGLSWAGRYKRIIKDLEESKTLDGLSKTQRHKLDEVNAKIAEREAIKYWVRRILVALIVLGAVAYFVAPLLPEEFAHWIQWSVVNVLWIHGMIVGAVVYILVTLFANVSIWKLEDKKAEIFKSKK